MANTHKKIANKIQVSRRSGTTQHAHEAWLFLDSPDGIFKWWRRDSRDHPSDNKTAENEGELGQYPGRKKIGNKQLHAGLPSIDDVLPIRPFGTIFHGIGDAFIRGVLRLVKRGRIVLFIGLHEARIPPWSCQFCL